MERWCSKAKPYSAMILQQLGLVGMYVITGSTLKSGINQYVLVVYRNIIAAIVIAPFAFYFERKHTPRITMVIFLKIVALAFLDPVCQQNLFYEGVKLTTISFACALETLIPAITYLMALALRLEKLQIKKRYGQAKVIGTFVNVVGAILLVLYTGPILQFPWYSKSTKQYTLYNSTKSNQWIKGTFCIIGSSSFWSAFLILQSNTLESFPSELTMTALICFMGTIMSAVVALIMKNEKKSSWISEWDITKLSVALYSGVMCTGVSYYLQGVVLRTRGPVFASAFGPISIILTAIMGSIFLSEKISLGMTIGVIIMIIGRYALLWGKSKDKSSSRKVMSTVEEELTITIDSSSSTL